MSDRLEREKNTSLAKNVMMLMGAQFITKVMGLIYRIVIINIDGFGNEGNGYYSIGYTIYSVLLTLSSIGVPNVIAKLISERLAAGDHRGSQRILKVCFGLFLSISFASACLLFFGADFIASVILDVPDVAYTMKALAPAVFFASAAAVLRGYFSGRGSLKATSTSQVVEQFFNCVLSIVFVYLCIGRGSAVMAAAGNVSTSASVAIAFLYLVFFYLRRRRDIRRGCEEQTVPAETHSTRELLHIVLALSIPMAVGSLISALNDFIDSFTITNCIQTAYAAVAQSEKELEAMAASAAGLLSKVSTIINLPLALNTAFSTALVPAISAAVAKHDRKLAGEKITFSLFASLVIVLPCAVGLAVLASPVLQMLYPTVSDGAGLLALSTVPLIFLALTCIINGGLYGLGEVRLPAASLAVGAVIKLVLNWLLIREPSINVYGAVISSIVCDIVVFLLVFNALRHRLPLQLRLWKHLFKPLLCSGVMGGAVFGTHRLLCGAAGNAVATVAAVVVGVAVYAAMLLLSRVFTKEEMAALPMGGKIVHLLEKLHVYQP
ncbi:MAG: polysaccharide biosynthesis protein [Ruminococcaceae bacterium]|nr:polysaccharide biosynthesis protein [Oscillospiraceae bacterium]